MSKIGWRMSWLVIVASLAFMAGYLLRYGNPATGQSASPSQPAVAPPGGPLALAPAAPVQAPAAATVSVAPPRAAAVLPSPTSAKPAASPPKSESPAVPTAEAPSQPAGGTATAPPQTSPQTPPAASPAPAPAPQTPPPADAPRITFAETVYDFGVMWQEQEVTHEYVFTNTGKSVLNIANVTSGCGCTAALPSKKEFAPGESGTIKVSFHSGRYRDRVTKYVNVDSADPVQPRVVLTLTGIVKVDVDVVPSGVYIGSIRIGESAQRSVTINPAEVKKFTVLGVKSDNPLVQVGAPEPVPNKEGSYQFKVTYGPADKVGRVNAMVTVHTDLPHTKDISIAVFGRIVEKEPPSAPAPATP